MNRLNSHRQEVKQLQKKIEQLEKRPPKIDLFSKIVFPLVSLIVAGIGAYTSWNAHQLSKAAFDLNIEPLLNSIVSVDYYANKDVSLKLYNEGVNSIYDIHIKKDWVIFNLKKNDFGSMITGTRDWQYVEKMPARDSAIFQVPKSDFERIVHNINAEAHWVNQPRSTLFATVVFHIRYRREPDKKMYQQRKYLYLPENLADSSRISFVTQDEIFARQFRYYEFKLDSLYSISKK